MAGGTIEPSNFEICLVCILHSKFNLFAVLNPAKGFCQHLFPKIKDPFFRISKVCISVIYFMTIFIIGSVLSYFFYLPKTCRENVPLCLMSVAEQCFGFTSTALVSVIILQVKNYENELNITLYFFTKPKEFNLKKITSFGKLKFLKFRRFVVSVLLFIFFTVLIILHQCFPEENTPLGIFRKIGVILCYILQCSCLFEVLQKIFLLGITLEVLEESIQSIDDQPSVDFFLKKFIDLVHFIHKLISLTMNYMSIVSLVWLVSSVILLILNFFIVIKYHNQNFYRLMVLHLRTLITTIAILIVLVQVETKVNRKVSLLYFIYGVFQK